MPSSVSDAATGRIAIADIGSNTIKYSAFDVSDRSNPRLLASGAETVRLGADIDKTGRIGVPRVDRAVDVLRRFMTDADALGASSVFGVATEAVRRASNGAAVLDELMMRTGWRLRVIDGLEEARLTFRGLQPILAAFPACLAADIGGASTELLHVVAGDLVRSTSVPIGSGRFADTYYGGANSTLAALMAARPAASAGVAPVLPAGSHGLPLVLSGGNGLYLDRLNHLLHPERVLGIAALEGLMEDMAAMPESDIATLLAVSVERAGVLPAGCAIALGIADAVRPSRIVAAPSGIREGLLRDWLEGEGVSAAAISLPELAGQSE